MWRARPKVPRRRLPNDSHGRYSVGGRNAASGFELARQPRDQGGRIDALSRPDAADPATAEPSHADPATADPSHADHVITEPTTEGPLPAVLVLMDPATAGPAPEDLVAADRSGTVTGARPPGGAPSGDECDQDGDANGPGSTMGGTRWKWSGLGAIGSRASQAAEGLTSRVSQARMSRTRQADDSVVRVGQAVEGRLSRAGRDARSTRMSRYVERMSATRASRGGGRLSARVSQSRESRRAAAAPLSPSPIIFRP